MIGAAFTAFMLALSVGWWWLLYRTAVWLAG
jgi:hypothetical protein